MLFPSVKIIFSLSNVLTNYNAYFFNQSCAKSVPPYIPIIMNKGLFHQKLFNFRFFKIYFDIVEQK